LTRRFLESPAPIAFAHRGGAEEAPENTMAAFESAVALGFRYLETDVHMTRDGTVVAFHDAALDRVTDRRGRIEALQLAEVRAADAGFWFSRDGGRTHPFRGRGCTVPTVEELLTRWDDVFVNLDPKSDAAVAPLVALLRRLGACERVCVGSFSDSRLARFRALSGGRVCTSMARRAVAAARLASFARRPVARLGADCMQVPVRWGRIRVVDRALIAAAHRSGLPVHVWTVNDEQSMARVVDLGVDGIMSDRPRLLRDLLQARGLWTGAAAAAT
jgi:glycerophosphoryl diester phosphodiesterase